MCRLFGGLSAKPTNFSDFLLTDRCNLLRQADARKDKPQADGWGIAELSKDLFVFRSRGWATKERETFKAVASGLKSRTVVGHLRRASNPLKLSQGKLLAEENIQPFCHGGWAFGHNGQVNDPLSAKKALDDWACMVRGTNDSEVYFWHFLKAYNETRHVGEALTLTEERLAESCRKKEPFTSLNVVLARENELYAWCRYLRQPKTVKKSLCMGKQGYYSMSYLAAPAKVAAMSEMSREGDWVIMEDGDLMSARLKGKKVEWKLENLQ